MDIVARLQSLPVGRFHYKLLVLVGLGWLFDAMDTGMVSFVLATLGKEWGLSPKELGWVVSIGFVGMAIGAVMGGRTADKIGRKTVFAVSLVVYSIATALCAAAPDLGWLLVFRFFVGVGLGAQLPVAVTLVSEYVPAKPPGRDVMQAAARAARQDMMQRIRDNKAAQGGAGRGQGGRGGQSPRNAPAINGARRAPVARTEADAGDVAQRDDAMPLGADGAPQGDRANRNRRRRGRGGAGMGGNGGQHGGQGAPRQQNSGVRQSPGLPPTREFGFDDEDDRDMDRLPRNIDPLQTNLHGRRNAPRGPSHGAAGQPDPMRTSIDMMGKGANRNKGNRSGGNGGGGGRGNFGGGGGNRNRAGGGFSR